VSMGAQWDIIKGTNKLTQMLILAIFN